MWANGHGTEALVHTSYRSATETKSFRVMETPVRISVPQLTKFGPGIIPSDDYIKKKSKKA